MLSLNQKNKSEVFRTAIYLRLSKDDGDKAESDSITNQRMLIRDYIRGRSEFCVVDEYVDDGYSGSNFDRPSFQKLYEDCKSGAVNCIIVKDLSRFGRNYIEVGRFLERIFPMLGVRLIAINDNYDGASEWKNSDAIIVPIKNLMNDAYCRDMSVKIKSQLEAKRKRGDFVANYTPYGYKKHPKKKNQLVIDEKTADIVRQIFQWKLEGMSDQGIADRLNERGVLCPLEYKLSSGEKIAEPFKRHEQAMWSSKAVFRILHNEVYVGNLVQGKRKKLDYRSKEIVILPKSKWVTVKATHEAIIDADQFQLVQNIVEKDTRIAPGKDTVSLFSGYVECGDCHNSMVRRSSKARGNTYYYLICNTYKKDHSCSTHNLSYDKLYQIVLAAVQAQIAVAVKTGNILEEIDHLPIRQKRVIQLDGQLVKLQDEMERFQRIKKKLYEDYQDEILTREEFREYSEMYSQRIADRQDAMKRVSKERLEAIKEQADSAWIKAFRKYENIEELSRPLMVELIKKIYVYEGGRVEIEFQYEDAIREAQDALASYGKEA